MADNTDEEHLDSKPIPLSEDLPNPDSSTFDKGANNINQETENMEVHHHPSVEKKNFKEFFMIFLAVTMGFIAENIRENKKEHECAKVYAESMINDLREDTTNLNLYLSYMTYASGNLDTFLQLITSDNIKNIPSGKLYWYGLFGAAENTFTPNDATFQQMKSSGSLKIFYQYYTCSKNDKI